MLLLLADMEGFNVGSGRIWLALRMTAVALERGLDLGARLAAGSAVRRSHPGPGTDGGIVAEPVGPRGVRRFRGQKEAPLQGLVPAGVLRDWAASQKGEAREGQVGWGGAPWWVSCSVWRKLMGSIVPMDVQWEVSRWLRGP